jgi:hypothetical protein
MIQNNDAEWTYQVLEALDAMVSNEEGTITKVVARISMQRKRRLRRSQRGKH